MELLLIAGILYIVYRFRPQLQPLSVIAWPQQSKTLINIFNSYYLEGKNFYLYRFNKVPSRINVDNIDITHAIDWVRQEFADRLADVFEYTYWNRKKQKHCYNNTVFVLDNKVMIDLYNDCVDILYTGAGSGFARQLAEQLITIRSPEKSENFEINVITLSRDGPEMKRLDIKPTNLDLNLYYNDDFAATDRLIRERLNKSNDKGIILLHGLPGTGKTTYLRHLIGGLNKKLLFVSPAVAGDLMNPLFIDLLIDNPNTVLVIEDAENIIHDRKQNSDSPVSNLLNISDGLLSDCLGVQVICTFNSDLHRIDPAILRKGRLIARYEFGKLAVEKAQRLSGLLGFGTVITEPMTIAEIANQHEKNMEVKQKEAVGFRTNATAMN